MYCPTQILEAVKEDAFNTAAKRENAVAAKDARDLERNRQLLIEIFPRIPPGSLKEILKHSFEKASGRVGRTSKLEEDLRAEFAVTAHIRHCHTDYDENYRQVASYNDLSKTDLKSRQRARVYDQVKAIADSWRGCKDGEDVRRILPPRASRPVGPLTESAQHARIDTAGKRTPSNIQEKTLEGALKDLCLSNRDEEARERRQKKEKTRKALRKAAETEAVRLATAKKDHLGKDFKQKKINPKILEVDATQTTQPDATTQTQLPQTFEPKTSTSIGGPQLAAQAKRIQNVAGKSSEEEKRVKGKSNKRERRRVNLHKDLEKLKRDPGFRLSDTRMRNVANLHQRLGGDVDSLGGQAKAHVQARLASLEQRKAKKAQKKAQWKEKEAEEGQNRSHPVPENHEPADGSNRKVGSQLVKNRSQLLKNWVPDGPSGGSAAFQPIELSMDRMQLD